MIPISYFNSKIITINYKHCNAFVIIYLNLVIINITMTILRNAFSLFKIGINK